MKILLVNEGSLGRAGICLFLFQWTKILAEILPDSTITVYFRLGVGDTALEKEFRKAGYGIKSLEVAIRKLYGI